MTAWRVGLVGLVLLVGGGGAVGEPGAAQVLDDWRLASGGAAWASIHTLHTTGSLRSGGLVGALEYREDLLAGRYVTRSTVPPSGSADGFDGVSVWHQGRTGIAYRLGDVDAQLNAANESYRVARGWWFADRHGATIRALAGIVQAGRRLDRLEITPEGGRAFVVWIDHATHLPERTVEQQAEDVSVVRFSDYRRVHGVMLPFLVRQGDGSDDDDVETVSKIDVDAPASEAAFSLPPRPAPDIAMPNDSGSVTVPFHLDGNRILVPLSVDGRAPIEAEFDSGGGLILPPALVASMRLATNGRLRESGGGEGFIQAQSGVAERVSIGGASILRPAFKSFAIPGGGIRQALVGLETLQRFVVRFDFDSMLMTLTRPEAFVAAGHATVLPFHFQDNQPEIAGAVDGIAGLFTVDTGDSGSLLLIAPFARRYRMVERYYATIPYEGIAISATHGVWTRVGEVSFDGPDGRPVEVVHRPVTGISLQTSGFDANRNVSGNIGLGILRQFTVTFDYPRQQIMLERNHQYGEPDVFNRAGLRVSAQDDHWVVGAIYPGSPAAALKLHPGDILTAINGQKPANLAASAAAELFKAPVGTSIHLTKGTQNLTLTLRDLL